MLVIYGKGKEDAFKRLLQVRNVLENSIVQEHWCSTTGTRGPL
jgi:hypothetical protein